MRFEYLEEFSEVQDSSWRASDVGEESVDTKVDWKSQGRIREGVKMPLAF